MYPLQLSHRRVAALFPFLKVVWKVTSPSTSVCLAGAYRALVNSSGVMPLTCTSAIHAEQSVSGPVVKLVLFIFTAADVQKHLNHGDTKKRKSRKKTHYTDIRLTDLNSLNEMNTNLLKASFP